jgi:hypothetical protein
MGMRQANEALKVLLGIGDTLAGRLLLFDALDSTFTELKLRRDPACPVCSTALLVLALVVAVGAPVVSRWEGHHPVRPPTCPTVWALVVAPAPTVADLDQTERAMGGQADLVYFFHDINDVIPSSYDAAVVARGQILHLTSPGTTRAPTRRP